MTFHIFAGQKSSTERMIAAPHTKPETTMIRTSVTRFSYAKECFIAIKRSVLKGTKWLTDAMTHLKVIAPVILCTLPQNRPVSPFSIKLKWMICKGWTTSPTTRSVVAKQASDTLDLVRSRRLVFTATITKMFRKMTKGQLIALAMILKINTARSSGESLSAVGRERYGTEPQLTGVLLMEV